MPPLSPFRLRLLETNDGRLWDWNPEDGGGMKDMLQYITDVTTRGIVGAADGQPSTDVTAKTRLSLPAIRPPSIVPRKIFNTVAPVPPSSTGTVQRAQTRTSLAPSPPPTEMRRSWHHPEPQHNHDRMVLDDSNDSESGDEPRPKRVAGRRARRRSPPRRHDTHEDDNMHDEDEPEQRSSSRQGRERRDSRTNSQSANNSPERRYPECPKMYEHNSSRNLLETAREWYREVFKLILKDELARNPELGISDKGDKRLHARVNALIFKLSCHRGTTVLGFPWFYKKDENVEKFHAIEKRVLGRALSRTAKPTFDEFKRAAMKLGMTEEQVNLTSKDSRPRAGDKRPAREDDDGDAENAEDDSDEVAKEQEQNPKRHRTGQATSSRTTRTSAPRKETELESHMNEDEIYQIARLLRKMRPKDDMQDVYKQMTVEFPRRGLVAKEWERLHKANKERVTKKISALNEESARRNREKEQGKRRN